MISYVFVHRFCSFNFALIPYIDVILLSKFRSFALARFKIIHEIR